MFKQHLIAVSILSGVLVLAYVVMVHVALHIPH
jgi:hypothetical protein